MPEARIVVYTPADEQTRERLPQVIQQGDRPAASGR
jgi:hypothetical protein